MRTDGDYNALIVMRTVEIETIRHATDHVKQATSCCLVVCPHMRSPVPHIPMSCTCKNHIRL